MNSQVAMQMAYNALNYHYLAAMHEGVSLTSSTIAKTDRRFTSETSLHYVAAQVSWQFINLLKDVSDVPFIGVGKFQDPSFTKKGTLNDARCEG